MQNELTEAQETAFGEKLVAVMGLKPDKSFDPPRYHLKEGYGTKTALGVARVMAQLRERAEKGK